MIIFKLQLLFSKGNLTGKLTADSDGNFEIGKDLFCKRPFFQIEVSFVNESLAKSYPYKPNFTLNYAKESHQIEVNNTEQVKC